jgi:hypothetical protein
MNILKSLFWAESDELLYRRCAGAYQTVSEFHFKLDLELPKVIDTEYIHVDKQGRVTVKIGFMWNGADGPTFDTPDSIPGSLGHDIGYWLMRECHLPIYIAKPIVDRWFYERLQKDGMWQPRAHTWWVAVQQLGGYAVLPRSEPDVLRAPIPFPVPAQVFRSPIPGYHI